MAASPLVDFKDQNLAQLFARVLEQKAHIVEDRVDRLEGGITDNPLTTQKKRDARLDNLVANAEGRPRVHGGSMLAGRRPGVALPVKIRKGIDALIPFGNEDLLIVSRGEFYRYNQTNTNDVLQGTFEKLDFQGFTGGVFARGAVNYTWAQMNNEVVVCSGELDRPFLIYKDDGEVLRGHYLALPKVPSFTLRQFDEDGGALLPNIPMVNDEGTNTEKGSRKVVYRVVPARRYNSSGLDKRDLGGTTAQAIYLNTEAHSVTVRIPPLTLHRLYGGLEVDIYRTWPDADASFRVHQQVWDGGAIEFEDDLEDIRERKLPTGARLYTETAQGVEPENLPPPKARYVVEAGNRVVLGAVQYESVAQEKIESRVVYSKVNQPYAFPAGNFEEVNYRITGVGEFKNNAIVFTRSSAHRLEQNPRGGNLASYKVKDYVGLVAPRSLAQTDQGLYYVSVDGFYMTDGITCRKMSDHIDETFEAIADKESMFSLYDPIRFKIYFFYKTRKDQEDMGKALILDLLWSNLSRNGGQFTTYVLDNGKDMDMKQIRTKASVWFDNRIYRGNRDGTLSIQDRNYFYHDLVSTVQGYGVRQLPVYFDFLSGGKRFQADSSRKDLCRLSMATLLREGREVSAIQGYIVTDGVYIYETGPIVQPREGDSPIVEETGLGRGATVITKSTQPPSKGRVGTIFQFGLRNGRLKQYDATYAYRETMADGAEKYKLELSNFSAGVTAVSEFALAWHWVYFVDGSGLECVWFQIPPKQDYAITTDVRGGVTTFQASLAVGKIPTPTPLGAADMDGLVAKGKCQIWKDTAVDFDLVAYTLHGQFGGGFTASAGRDLTGSDN